MIDEIRKVNRSSNLARKIAMYQRLAHDYITTTSDDKDGNKQRKQKALDMLDEILEEYDKDE